MQNIGNGVSKENQKLIFEEFRQVSEGYSRNYEGRRLGLIITQKLVEKLGGEISVECEVSKGSIIIVKLHIASAE